MRRWFISALLGLLTIPALHTPAAAAPAESKQVGYQVGVAKLDVTPAYPVRLSGYSNRKDESAGVEQSLFAKALAVQAGNGKPVVVVTVDSLGVSANMTEAVAARLQAKHGMPRENVAVCASHTHSAPALPDTAGLLFPPPVPAEHTTHMRQYQDELTQKLGDVALAALEKLEPAQISYGVGTAKFAVNRRLLKDGKWTGFGVVPEGVVDHSLPLLVVKDAEGKKLRAVLINYACHCTTLGGNFNKIHGDWAGCAQEQIEREHPGCTALVSIGCGADANPNPRTDDLAVVRQHGDEVAKEVDRLLQGKKTLTQLAGAIATKRETFNLPLADLPTKAEYEARAATKGPIAWHAKAQLERLAAGKKLPTVVPYSAQTWTFGDTLAMVFLPGEVVVDYQLRLKRELDAKRLWINAYSNASPCYIASARVLGEGGYEVDGSMYYYDQPQHFAPAVEDLIVDRVRGLLPTSYNAAVRFAAEIAKIEAREKETPPPAGGILFLGSSTIRLWKLESSFSDLPVINHGFGGSQISDSIYYFDRLVTRVQPRQIVFYAGGNDLNAGKSPEQVHRDFATFVQLVREKLPQTKLTYIALAPSVKRWSQSEKQRRANELIAAEVARQSSPLLEFVPVEKRILGADGQPQPQLYLPDMLHFNAAGYAILNDIVRPYLK